MPPLLGSTYCTKFGSTYCTEFGSTYCTTCPTLVQPIAQSVPNVTLAWSNLLHKVSQSGKSLLLASTSNLSLTFHKGMRAESALLIVQLKHSTSPYHSHWCILNCESHCGLALVPLTGCSSVGCQQQQQKDLRPSKHLRNGLVNDIHLSHWT